MVVAVVWRPVGACLSQAQLLMECEAGKVEIFLGRLAQMCERQNTSLHARARQPRNSKLWVQFAVFQVHTRTMVIVTENLNLRQSQKQVGFFVKGLHSQFRVHIRKACTEKHTNLTAQVLEMKKICECNNANMPVITIKRL